MSSETGPSPDKEPAKDPLYLEGAPEALQIEMIDKLRDSEAKLVARHVRDAGMVNFDAQEKARAEAHAEFYQLIEKHLEEHGISNDEDDEKYAEYVEFLRDCSIDHIPENVWKDGKRDDEGKVVTPPVRNAAYDKVKKEYTPEPKKDDDEPKKDDEPTDEEPKKDDEPKDEEPKEDETEKLVKERLEKIAQLEEELKGVQAAKHTAFAARMAVSYFAKSKKKELSTAYEQAEKAYIEKIKELEALKIQEMEEKAQEEINEAIAERFTKRLKDDHDMQKEAMLKEGGLKAKILEKYQNLSKGKKIALALGAGALIAAGGAGLGALAGLIGTGLAAGAAGGITIGAKSARTYATAYSRIYAQKADERLKFSFDYPRAHSTESALDLAIGHLKRESRQDIESADKTKRNAVLMAMGTAATAGILGAGAMDALDAYANRGAGWIGGVVGNEVAGTPVSVAPGSLDPAHTWEVTPPAPVAEEVLQFSPEAKVLNPGDGGFRIMERMDIPQDHWHQMWQEVGPELQNVQTSDGKPFSYLMPNGEWGVRMTPDGKVPDGALQLISEKHEALFGTEPSSATTTTEVVTPTAVPPEITPTAVEQPVIAANEAPVLKDVLSQPTINSADIAANSELFDKLTHVAPNVELHTYMTEALGVPEQVWIESVQPFIEEKLSSDNPLYTTYFYESPQGIRFTGNGQLPDVLMAELLQSVPFATRNSFTLVG